MSAPDSVSSLLADAAPRSSSQEERFEKVRTLIYEDSASAARALAAQVAGLIRERGTQGRGVVLGLATGSTPVPFYRELIRVHREEGLSFRAVTTFNLDEYHGLPRDHPESYYRFMRDQLFDHLDIPDAQIHLPDGTVPLDGVHEHCLDYERRIDAAGGIDLQILGIGRTGHIGFNEPGSEPDSITRMITLDRVTRQDAAADFMGVAQVPRSAITMGVGTILRARHIALMAWGSNKSEIVATAVEGPMCAQVSASFLQSHPAATFLVDRAASAHLTRHRHPWLVGMVDWDAAMKKRAVLWLSGVMSKPILKLVDEEYNEKGVGELLATTSQVAYEVNIDIFNHVQHTITGWPGGKPGSDDSHRPERATPFPKRILVLSPEPADAIVGMGGTLRRLKEQGHQVQVAMLTAGDLRVGDIAALNFARVLQEMAESSQTPAWESQRDYAQAILTALEEKGTYGIDPELVRRLKGLILRGEARDAAETCGLSNDDVGFLDLPFYAKGRYRRFSLGEEDSSRLHESLEAFQPQMIFATGGAGDPSSISALCFETFVKAWRSIDADTWRSDCRVWLYRGRDRALEAHEIDMAVPLSPDQTDSKAEAIRKFMSLSDHDAQTIARNRETAALYDALGLAEYESIEAFQRWVG
jgi:glucosamine-6-phosphate deaminase